MADRYRYWILGLWAVIVVAYVRFKAPVIVAADWSHDDLMNCYRAMTTTWGELFKQLVLFWQPSSVFRPLGEMFYKLFWEQFGFDPLPWRLACGGLMIANAFLAGHVAMRLSGSLSVGLAATALASYHWRWSHLYLNTGTVFEILAFTFVYAGLAWYVEFDDPWGTIVLMILGLNAKESVIVLAPLVVIYELIWKRRVPWLFCGLATAVCAGFIVGRVYGPGGLAGIGMYKPSYTLTTYLERFRGYFNGLILWNRAPLTATLLLWLAPLAFRNRLSLFATLLFPIAILPLAFVPDRGLEGVYVACAALPLALASSLLLIPKEDYRLAGAVVLFAAFAVWMPAHPDMAGWDKENREIRTFREGLKAALPEAPAQAQIRFKSEPFGEQYPWASTFITGLVYKDPSIVVVSPNNPHTKDLSETSDFAVFEWKQNRLQRIK